MILRMKIGPLNGIPDFWDIPIWGKGPLSVGCVPGRGLALWGFAKAVLGVSRLGVRELFGAHVRMI